MKNYVNHYIEKFSHNPPFIVGILNITPDSFSDGGKYLSIVAATNRAWNLTEEGADIVDIGGESTRPGSSPVGDTEEMRRIKDVVKALAPKMFLSIDTYRAKTADICLSLGAKMINDVSAMRYDPEMRAVVKEHDAYVVLMYSKEEDQYPHVINSKKTYVNVIREIIDFLRARIDYALAGGIAMEKIILDPGMGAFISNNPQYSWELLQRFEELSCEELPAPLMVATSRKGFLGGAIEKRDLASQLTALIAAQRGASFIRTHNVKMMSSFLGNYERMQVGKIDSAF